VPAPFCRLHEALTTNAKNQTTPPAMASELANMSSRLVTLSTRR
jgi:hypothetical protein